LRQLAGLKAVLRRENEIKGEVENVVLVIKEKKLGLVEVLTKLLQVEERQVLLEELLDI